MRELVNQAFAAHERTSEGPWGRVSADTVRQVYQQAREFFGLALRQLLFLGKLHGLALPGRVAITFCLAKRVGASIEILKTVNKGSCKTQKRIRPIGAQFRRFTKCGNGVRQIALSFRELTSGSFGFAVDPVQVPLAIAQRRS